MECGFDNGSEFKSLFIDLCENFGLKPKRTTDYNPQSNVIIERVHAVLGNSFRTFELEKRELDEDNPFEEFLTATVYAIVLTRVELSLKEGSTHDTMFAITLILMEWWPVFRF